MCRILFLIRFLFVSNYFAVTLTHNLNVMKHPNWRLFDHENCGVSMANRIIGGDKVPLGKYPWLAQLGYSNNGTTHKQPSFRCGGALINRMYVLTAAHCVTNIGPAHVSIIRLGENNAATEIDCEENICAAKVQDFRPSAIIAHANHDSPNYSNDIALIRLDRPAHLNGWVLPICLPSGNQLESTYVGRKAEVAGWGVYDVATEAASDELLYVSVPVVDDKICVDGFKSNVKIGHGQMCVGGVIGEDSCNGDSGGPLMLPESINGPPQYYIVGIVSFGPKVCGGSSLPAVYTRISSYIHWVLDKVY